MSEENKSTNALAEKETKVVISPEDCNAALDFWRHFDIPIAPSLQAAIDDFAKEASVANQDKVKLEVCKAISQTDHEAFKDEMFKKIAEECGSVTFDMEFDKDFEQTVAVQKE